MFKRRNTRSVRVGRAFIGSRFPVLVQSMAKAKTADAGAVIAQIQRIKDAGCSTVRVAVKDEADACAIAGIKKNTGVNLIADIHFNYKLALLALEKGADKVRLNPGNIFKKREIKEVVKLAVFKKAPIRVGLNSGSVRMRPGQDVAGAMVKSALKYCEVIGAFGLKNLVVSLKASTVMDTIRACRMFAGLCDYPLHLGVTASGLTSSGIIKSALGIGALLSEGIGDTIRVSLTASPEEEICCARGILQALGLAEYPFEIISCPACGRCSVNLADIVKSIDARLRGRVLPRRYKKIALMGCAVNGPGEAKMADIGLAFGARDAMLFEKGRPVRKIPYNKCVDELCDIIIKK